MSIRHISTLALVLLLPLTLQAQKRKVQAKKPVAVAPAEPVEDPRITEMRELTQQIVFIDSVVVDKDDFLPAIRINAESGRLTTTSQFLGDNNLQGYAFLNEMGNKCYFSALSDEGRMQLFTSDKLGGEWSEPMELSGIGQQAQEANYPFMMSDGTTFYFAARGSESIGGYDIFVTRYDSEGGQFLKPENIGMPFNSEANDYMYVVDEMSSLGYFVTDRRQPAGKVCVYIFIPPTSRRTYNLGQYTEGQLRGFADISRIADTWGNGKERKQALERLRTIGSASAGAGTKEEMHFVVNDQLTYTSTSQFRSPESPLLYRELCDSRKQLAEITKQLEQVRNFFVQASAEDKAALRAEILDAEQQMEQLSSSIRSLEKRIRNDENLQLNRTE